MNAWWHALPPPARRSGFVGALALVTGALGGMANPQPFFEAWLVTWLFLVAIAAGALAMVMIHELTGGAWGDALRAPLEAAMSTLPLVALLAVPLAFGLPHLFWWARPETPADLLQDAPRWYLDARSFLIRNAVSLAVLSLFARAMKHELRGGAPSLRARRIAVAGLLVYLALVTIAAYDWIASLVPHFASTALGVRLGAAQFVAALAFAVSFASLATRARRGSPLATASDRRDFGNLLLTFTMMWAYIAFTQYLIVWGGDLPREIAWYAPRAQTTWRWLGVGVVVLEFALPVALMLFRAVKMRTGLLAAVCVAVLAGQWLDGAWLTLPSLRTHGLAFHWLDPCLLIGLCGLWLAAVIAHAEHARPARVRSAGPSAIAHG